MTTIATANVALELSRESLVQLTDREAGAIHVRGFYPAELAAEVAAKALDHPALGHYHKKYTSSVGRVYMPHVDTKWDADLTAQYHDGALAAIEDVRSMFSPYLSPVDYMRLRLDELWPGGAHIMRLRNRSCFVGAIRVFQPGTSEFYPHNDRIDQETDAPEIAAIREQLVANMYLQVPDEGGDLQLWLRDPAPDEQARIMEVEGLEPDTVEPPPLTIHPEAGDLIIFSSRTLHAVTPGNGHRVGMASFIGVRGVDEPLLLWS